MEERLDRVVSLPRESGLAEELMLKGDLVREMIARKARGEGVKRIARELGVIARPCGAGSEWVVGSRASCGCGSGPSISSPRFTASFDRIAGSITQGAYGTGCRASIIPVTIMRRTGAVLMPSSAAAFSMVMPGGAAPAL